MRKTTYINGVMQQNDVRNYINGIEYKGLNNVLDRFPTTEGAVVLQSDGTTYQYEYTIKDHLGNVRVTYSDANNDGFVGVTDIKQVNHFYPYGLNMEGNWNGSFAEAKNKYQYNGKEWNDDFGLGWNHHDWRFYDPAISRFVAVDRLPEEEGQESFSPYHFSYDNPIRFDDPDGQCPNCFTAAVGAAAGGLIGGLIEAGSQLYHDGKISNGGAVIGASVQGAVTGGAAGFTFGGSLVATAAVAGIANGVGGAANKTIQGEQITAGSVAKDAAIGAAGGAVGAKVAAVVAKKAITSAAQKVVNQSAAAPVNTARELAAAARNPKLAPVMRGKGVDRAFRQQANTSKTLDFAQKSGMLKVNPRNNGADMVGKGALKGTWWDVTTQKSWNAHVQKYGSGGIPLLYK